MYISSGFRLLLRRRQLISGRTNGIFTLGGTETETGPGTNGLYLTVRKLSHYTWTRPGVETYCPPLLWFRSLLLSRSWFHSVWIHHYDSFTLAESDLETDTDSMKCYCQWVSVSENTFVQFHTSHLLLVLLCKWGDTIGCLVSHASLANVNVSKEETQEWTLNLLLFRCIELN